MRMCVWPTVDWGYQCAASWWQPVTRYLSPLNRYPPSPLSRTKIKSNMRQVASAVLSEKSRSNCWKHIVKVDSLKRRIKYITHSTTWRCLSSPPSPPSCALSVGAKKGLPEPHRYLRNTRKNSVRMTCKFSELESRRSRASHNILCWERVRLGNCFTVLYCAVLCCVVVMKLMHTLFHTHTPPVYPHTRTQIHLPRRSRHTVVDGRQIAGRWR